MITRAVETALRAAGIGPGNSPPDGVSRNDHSSGSGAPQPQPSTSGLSNVANVGLHNKSSGKRKRMNSSADAEDSDATALINPQRR